MARTPGAKWRADATLPRRPQPQLATVILVFVLTSMPKFSASEEFRHDSGQKSTPSFMRADSRSAYEIMNEWREIARSGARGARD
jgi:hypothetical protein